MTIEKNLNGTELTVTITGRLDTTTAPQLEAEFKQNINGVEKLVLDFAALEYLLELFLPLSFWLLLKPTRHQQQGFLCWQVQYLCPF